MKFLPVCVCPRNFDTGVWNSNLAVNKAFWSVKIHTFHCAIAVILDFINQIGVSYLNQPRDSAHALLIMYDTKQSKMLLNPHGNGFNSLIE